MKKQSNNKANVFTIDINQMIKQKNLKRIISLKEHQLLVFKEIRSFILKKVSIANDFTQKKMELL